jgi:hypothetical protein
MTTKTLDFMYILCIILSNMKLVADKYKQLKTIIRIVAGIHPRLTNIEINCKYNWLANLSATIEFNNITLGG